MKKLVFIISLGFILGITSCSNQGDSQKIVTEGSITKDLESSEFKTLIESGNGVILDVRTPEEVAEGKIDGSVNIDYYESDFKSKVEELDPNEPVYVYCAAGGRSSRAMADLKEMGFKEVYNLLGGYSGWPY